MGIVVVGATGAKGLKVENIEGRNKGDFPSLRCLPNRAGPNVSVAQAGPYLGCPFTMKSSKTHIKFEDFFPAMIEKLGTEGFMDELCNGFRLLMDREKGVITYESLKKNSVVLGLQGMTDDELMCMLEEGDLDGNGELNQLEFCVLMFRLSPELTNGSRRWIEEVLMNE